MSDLELTMMRRVGELNKEVAALKAENARLKAEVERLEKVEAAIRVVAEILSETDRHCYYKIMQALEGKPQP